ncbi:methyltransferase domain-containing protein [Irpex rosettiformis]|uniref:Methyltransferase domain-containing protein n=1 Tax=Irpex rosettiformis TaxID=378272 RepID=A0ACB8U2F5_9APHY|nr:methyltransferase domain-containing protein [Irpex rosettiformis]
MEHTDSEDAFLDRLHNFLYQSEVERFFAQHPNGLTSRDYVPPASWGTWWNWNPTDHGSSNPSRWELLWQYYSEPQKVDSDQRSLIPGELRSFIDSIRDLQLVRTCDFETRPPSTISVCPASADVRVEEAIHGMSPKKAHEVTRTVEYLKEVLGRLSASGLHVQHIVDVGAGQAYLSRALRDSLGLHVLALDWSDIQSDGAKRREKSKKKVSKGQGSKEPPQTGSLSYETLPINPRSLQEVVQNWVTTFKTSFQEVEKVPVLFVALHACGSLTLDILRTFLFALKDSSGRRGWRPAGALVVGCCYNLLDSEDQRSLTGRDIKFLENHLQMAAQAPLQWNRSSDVAKRIKLSFRKTAWRALLTGIIQERGATQDCEVVGKRLGRVNDAVYDSWPSFLHVASEKFGLDLARAERDQEAEGRIEIFQFFRCVLGPVVESFILLDRKLWLRNELVSTGQGVRLVNLFDQATGSARNVAIVVAPSSVTLC